MKPNVSKILIFVFSCEAWNLVIWYIDMLPFIYFWIIFKSNWLTLERAFTVRGLTNILLRTHTNNNHDQVSLGTKVWQFSMSYLKMLGLTFKIFIKFLLLWYQLLRSICKNSVSWRTAILNKPAVNLQIGTFNPVITKLWLVVS